MPTVIIIGFEYKEDLKSTITDIYQAYSFYRDIGYNIHIASDIEHAINPEDTSSLLISNTVDEYFLDFISNKFDKIRTLVKDSNEFITFIKQIKVPDSNLIFYYTGHGVDGKLQLPNNELLGDIVLNDMIIDLVGNKVDSKILAIFDCCDPHGMYLPFKYNINTEQLDLEIDRTVQFYLTEIIIITSSDIHEKTIAIYNESLFTKYLFKLFRDKTETYDYDNIIKYVKKGIKENDGKVTPGNVSIFSSSPILSTLWTWTVTNKIICYFNEETEALYVKLKT